MKQEFRLRVLSLVVIIYILAAVLWWSVLLFRKNEAYYGAQYQLELEKALQQGEISQKEAFFESENYKRLHQRYLKDKQMIIGEGVVFFLTLILGIWFINRGYLKEVSASRQRRNFLLSITHELKSPIAGIQLAAETMQKRDLSREQTDRLLHNTLRETARLKTLVNDLLLSAKLEIAYHPHLENLDFDGLLEEIVRDYQEKYPQAWFSYEGLPELHNFLGEAQGLTSVIQNLLDNAVKYSPEPAKINVRLKQSGNSLVLEVADEGFGIPEKERRNVFSKFYRIGNEDSRKTKGTGLGLYIVDQIVKAHRGSIVVGDNKPCGTIFTIELPFQKS